MSKKCFVHSERKHLATGYIYAVRRKWIEVALTIKGEEYSADCKKDAFVKNQQPFIERGRYIAISTTGRIHMCTCVWTKAMIDQAHENAKLFLAKIKSKELAE